MKKIQPRHYVYALLLLLILGSYISILINWHHQRGEIDLLNAQIASVEAHQASQQGPTYSDATISPSENAVYIPLAKLKLASSSLTENLVYTYTGPHTIPGDKKVFPADLSISTHDLDANAGSATRQFDCTEVAYADFVTPSYPVNPMWKSDGSTKLADGRVMNIYYAPSIPGCKMPWQLSNVNSKAIADSLKHAVSY